MSFSLTHEYGTVRKKWKGRIPVALLYPHTYAVAVSNLGFQLVYSLLNRIEDLVCERFVYPEEGGALRSLESLRPLTDFPLVLASVSFEHDYPRLAALLAAGGIEPLAGRRGQPIGPGSPLVVLGGVGVFLNPEPLAAFADLMVIGEAEPILPLLIKELVRYGDSGRAALLQRLGSTLAGCYVPSGYSLTYADNGEVREIRSAPGLPQRVVKVTAAAEGLAGHSTLLSPQAELGMYMVELGRGCSRGCRFCAAGFIYRPPRLWTAEAVLAGISQRPAHIDRVGLLGMEMASAATIDQVAGYLRAHQCSLSFSSLRADRISDELIALLTVSGLKSVAIAADGCSERLRTLINKGLGSEDLLAAGTRLVRAGIFHLKLYVMIGLPTEGLDDLAELVALVEQLQERILAIGRARGRVAELTLSVNCFVPKPWTPFQYCSFGGIAGESDGTAAGGRLEVEAALAALKGKIRFLRQQLGHQPNLRLKFDHPEQALEQAVFARADRRIGPVLLDIGTGRLSFKQAMKRHGLHPWQFAVRARRGDEVMCWEVVDHGIRPGYLQEEYQRAMRGAGTSPCEPAVCRRCGVCHDPA